MRIKILILAGLTALLSAPSNAHHSISRDYRTNESVMVEGIVVDVLLRNPHSEIRMEAPDAAGNTAVWILELDDLIDLAKQGIVSDTLRPGDEIQVVGNPARDGSNSLFVRRLHRPADGLDYEED